MDQKDWEERLDRYADRTAQAVKKGVGILEDAFEKSKETIVNETSSQPGAEPGAARKGSPRLGLAMVVVGLVWLLNTLGVLDQPILPILLIILGVYFVARSR